MKTRLILTSIILAFFIFGCEKEESTKKENIETSSISFTDCKTGTKSTDTNIPSIRIIGAANGKLTVKLMNTEFCCGTDSISLNRNTIDNKIHVEIIDNGPFTYCYCPHDLQFNLKSFDNKLYELTLVESEHAYSRDTFLIQFNYSEYLDTTITGLIPGNRISNYPLDYANTDFGGCNNMFKSAQLDNVVEADTLIFKEQADSLKIFVGLNLTCCIDFGSESEIVGDTLIMRISALNYEPCDCICYYAFDYNYGDYTSQGFYYKFYIDNYMRFEGKYNLP